MIKEIRRQFVHLFFGSIIILFIAFAGRELALMLAMLAFSIGIVLSMTVKMQIRLPLLHILYDKFGREKEKHLPGYGAILFFLGMVIVLFFFNNLNVIIGAMIVAVYGDAFSTMVGVSIGRHSIIKPYTIEGTLGGIIASFLMLLPFFSILPALATAVAGMLAEMLPIDDNLSIPIVSAAVLTLLL